MITPTTLLRHIKAQLGSTTRVLPISDDEILEIIEEETLPTFSKYYPYMYRVYVGKEDKLDYKEARSVYVMKTDGLEILGVAKVFRTDGSYNECRYPYYNTNNIFDIAIANNYLSVASTPETFAFYPPSLIELFPKNWVDKEFLVICKCIHPKSLQTIPPTLKDEFFDLATYDVGRAIAPILIHYDQLQTPYGQIELKIDFINECAQKREDLLEKFQSKFMKEPERRKIWIV